MGITTLLRQWLFGCFYQARCERAQACLEAGQIEEALLILKGKA